MDEENEIMIDEEEVDKSKKSAKTKATKKKGAGKAGGKDTQQDPESAKMEALENALAGIEKSFGKGAVMKMGEGLGNMDIPVITTGTLSIDVALGVGGIPRGRIIEVYGPESSGKTTMALHIVAEAQKAGGIAGYIDAEHALDPVYAKNLGVNIDELYISQPDDGEQALEICEAMVRSGAIDIVVIDSVAALVPRAEIEGAMGASHMGVQARLMSQALRKLTGFANKTKCVVLFINQLREKIGVTWGNPETTTGGRALKFYASVRIDVRKGQGIKMGDELVGSRTTIKIAKNKVAPPFKTCEVDIMYGKGFSKEGDVLDLGADLKVVTKSGAWYNYNETRLGQGRENAKNYLIEHPEITREIENAVRKHYGMKDLESIAAEGGVTPINESDEDNKRDDTGKNEVEELKIDELMIDFESGDMDAELIQAEEL